MAEQLFIYACFVCLDCHWHLTYVRQTTLPVFCAVVDEIQTLVALERLTSTARVARVVLWRMWKRRVLPTRLCPPLREVPPRWMIIGFPLKRLIRWAGSWPWVTRTCEKSQQWMMDQTRHDFTKSKTKVTCFQRPTGNLSYLKSLTWTGAPPMESSSLTVRKADAASSSWEHFRPCLKIKNSNENHTYYIFLIWNGKPQNHAKQLEETVLNWLFVISLTNLQPWYRNLWITVPPVGLDEYWPGVDDVLLAASHAIRVENQIAVSSEELPIGWGVHGHLLTTLHTPDLRENQQQLSTWDYTNSFRNVWKDIFDLYEA